MDTYEFESPLWRWQAQQAAAWFFVTMPADAAADLRMEAGPPRGFGSIRVEARIGATLWRTSVFPESGTESGTGAFVLPVKKAVRVAEGLEEDEICRVAIRAVEG